MAKIHIPGASASGLAGFSLCGRWAKYETGDHRLLRASATTAINEHREHFAYCTRCVSAQKKNIAAGVR